MSTEPGSDGSRRELLGAGLVLSAGLLLAGCGGDGHSSPLPPPPPPHTKISHHASELDVEVLNGLLDLEHKAIAAYSAGTPLLSGHLQRTARNFLGDELAHASELSSLITRHGGKPVRARPSYDLGHPGSLQELLQLFARVEQEQIAAYLGAIPLVRPGAMRASLGAILGSDAQHVALVRAALGEAPMIGAFVTASAP